VALGAISGYLAQERLALERDLTALLSMTERPLEVLREFLRISGVGAKPEIVSILLGINEESIGGDLSRHPSCQREALFGKGGFMYQPSEPQELWQIFSLLSLREGSKFYDLGSGYGHVLFCGAVLRPDITFKGIELMPVRVAECEAARSRHGIENLSFVAGDVTQGGFAEADIIFVFNPFPPDTMRAVREQIGTVARRKPLAVFDYGGMVTQGIQSLVPVVACDLAPYRLGCSRNFLEESRALVDIPAPNPKRKRGGRPAL
jgi:SAM-dependent methyltransferase